MLPLHPQRIPIPTRTTLITLPGAGVTICNLLQVPSSGARCMSCKCCREERLCVNCYPGRRGNCANIALSNTVILPASSPQPQVFLQSNSSHSLPSEQGPFSQPSLPLTPLPQGQPSLTDEQACSGTRPLSLNTPSMHGGYLNCSDASSHPISMVTPLICLSNGHSSPGPSSIIAVHQPPSPQLLSAPPSPASPPLALSANDPLLAQIYVPSQRFEVLPLANIHVKILSSPRLPTTHCSHYLA